MTESSVVFSHVSKVYEPSPTWLKLLIRSPIRHPVQALNDVSFAVEPGQICAVVGPNGAGKTTLFRILVGLTTPTAGRATVFGLDAVSDSLAIRRRLGWMPTEETSLILRLSCYENLRFHGRLKGLAGRRLQRAIDRALDIVGLSQVARSAVVTLSAGMRARLRLARAILHEPQLLILDEPTAAVDPVGSYDLLNLIVEMVRDRQLAALISSHRLDEIEALHSHVVLLNRGGVLFDGDLDELRRRLDRPHLEITTRSLESGRAIASLLGATGLAEILQSGDGKLRLAVPHDVAVGDVLVAIAGSLAEVVHLDQVKVPLRELLAEIYGADNEAE